MKYSLLAILLLSFNLLNAQKIWDQEAYSKMCKKQLTEVLAHIYEMIIEGKLTAYYNDSFATKYPINELKERFSDEYIANIGVQEGEDWVVDSLIVIPKDPRKELVGFSLIQSNTISSSELSTYITLGINLLYPLKFAGTDLSINTFLGINPLCSIKWDELKSVLSKEENDYLQAYIQTAKMFGNFEFIHFNNDTIGYLADNLSWRLANRAPYHLRLTKPWQKAITSAWQSQYIEAAHVAFNAEKSFYKEPQLRTKFNDLEMDLGNQIMTSIAQSEDPYDIKDTAIFILFDWNIEDFILLQAPKGPKVIGFKSENKWFYMKLEDLEAYLPKEVLPSLELLKKE